MNQALAWVKSHPTESLLALGAIGGLVFVLNRGSGSGSSLSTVANAQLQMANLNAQNAAQQAQLQAQENTAAYAAQTQNNQTAAELAAVVARYQAGIQTAQIAADVQNNQTNAAQSIASQQIDAQAEAYKTQINAETNALGYEYNYLTQAQQNQSDMVKELAPYVTSFNGSQNRLAYLQSLLNQPNAAIATEGSYAAVNNPAYNPLNSFIASITNAGASIAKGLVA